MINKKILILGGNGMLGKDMINAFMNHGFKNISYTTRKTKLKNNLKYIRLNIDKNIEPKIHKLKKLKFDIIINCIGIIKPRINENDIKSFEDTINVNALFPHKLANILNTNTKIFQITTDCVFSGDKGMYDENSKYDASDLYGMSKSLGEVKTNNLYNIRCSIIGRELSTSYSLVEWFLSQKNKKVNGFKDHLWNGVSTIVYSNLICSIIVNMIKIPNNLHIMPKDIVSKYKLLQIFEANFKNNVTVIPFISKSKIDRTLSTKFKKINNEIWNKSIYKKKLSINEIVKTI